MSHNRKVIMNHSLAKALMDAGMEHFDGGGVVGGGSGGGPFGGIAGAFTTQNDYNANLAPTQASNYGGAIDSAMGNAQAGYNQGQNIQGQQQQLANALLLQSQGHGPNPAQNALVQATNTNNQNAAGLIASQKGINPALAARMAAQDMARNNQTAAGQGATMQAQQQLAAQQALGGQQSNMASQNIAQQNASSNLLNTTSGAQNAQNNTNVQNAGMAQGINSQVSQNNANSVNKNEGGMLNAIGGALAGPLGAIFAKGGVVPDHLHSIGRIYHPQRFAGGGGVLGDSPGSISTPYASGFSNAGAVASTQALGAGSSGGGGMPPIPGMSDPMSGGGLEALGGGPMDAMGGAGGAAGGADALSSLGPLMMLAAQGGGVPGKAAVRGNSYRNDTVPAMVSPGEIVLPRSVTQATDAPAKAAEFVRHLQERNKGQEKDDPQSGYGKVAASRRGLKDRGEKREKISMGRAA